MKTLIVDNQQAARINTINEFGWYLRNDAFNALNLYYFVESGVETAASKEDLDYVLKRHDVSKVFFKHYRNAIKKELTPNFSYLEGGTMRLVQEEKIPSNGSVARSRQIKKLIRVCEKEGIRLYSGHDAGDLSMYFEYERYDMNGIQKIPLGGSKDIDEHLYTEYGFISCHHGKYSVGADNVYILHFTSDTLEDLPEFLKAYFSSKFKKGKLIYEDR